MNRNFSEEIIEIEGKEYKLFLNRAGIAIWEKTTKFSEFQNLLAQKYSELDEETFDKLEEKIIDENSLPSDLYGDFSSFDEDEKKLRESIIKFYWIVLEKNHKLTYAETKELIEKAENGTFDKDGNPNNDAYGIDQLVGLMVQMLQDANSNLINGNNLKNLKALKPAK